MLQQHLLQALDHICRPELQSQAHAGQCRILDGSEPRADLKNVTPWTEEDPDPLNATSQQTMRCSSQQLGAVACAHTWNPHGQAQSSSGFQKLC